MLHFMMNFLEIESFLVACIELSIFCCCKAARTIHEQSPQHCLAPCLQKICLALSVIVHFLLHGLILSVDLSNARKMSCMFNVSLLFVGSKNKTGPS